MEQEIWRDIIGYEKYYQASNFGRIKSLDRYVNGSHGGKIFLHGKIMKVRLDKDGCARVKLSRDGIKKVYLLARLIYQTFNSNFDYNDLDLKVYHKNKDQTKNNIDNLYVVSIKEIPKVFSEFFYVRREDKPVICITTNKKFNSVVEAGEFYKISYTGISACCNGRQKSAGKIILDDGTVYKLAWKFIESSN
jgi:hypothetical protein